MLRLFAANIVGGMLAACGAQSDIGASAVSNGGTTSNSTAATGGSTPKSNGDSTAIDVTTYCNGLLNTGCNIWQMLVLTGCDTPWQQAPPAGYPWDFAVVLDCTFPPLAIPDAGTPDGFYIDYNQSPAHLRLTGSYCASISTNGTYGLVFRQVCPD